MRVPPAARGAALARRGAEERIDLARPLSLDPAFERHLHRNGTRIIKFFLHLSKEEQRKRFSPGSTIPRSTGNSTRATSSSARYWDDYMDAYEDCLAETSTGEAPWYVVPADDKKNARLIVSRKIIETLDSLRIGYPKIDKERTKQLERVWAVLESDG